LIKKNLKKTVKIPYKENPGKKRKNQNMEKDRKYRESMINSIFYICSHNVYYVTNTNIKLYKNKGLL